MSLLDLQNLALLTVALVALSYYLRPHTRISKLPLPPGPRGLAVVGNIFDVPKTHPWKVYKEWSKVYNSDIIHLNLAGTPLIILCSLEATATLFEKRSLTYSDRPPLPMVMDLMGWDFNLCASQNTSWYPVISQFQRSWDMTVCVSASNKLFYGPCSETSMAGEFIMSAAYGIDVLPSNDPYIKLAHDAIHTFSVANVPGKYLVNTFPVLKYVPKWFPGAGFKRQAEPFAETKHQMESGATRASFSADKLHDLKQSPDIYYNEMHVQATAATMFIGGADTAVSALESFILGMLSSPGAQRRAQAEIDTVTGGKFFPSFDDRESLIRCAPCTVSSLPYISAIVKEVLRWEPVGPMALPRRLNIEDEYGGYRIPAGSIVFGNTWAIFRDEVFTVYPDPGAFNPERYLLHGKLNPAIKDPEAAFGFGQRFCPGKHIAVSSLWILVASILATFNIEKTMDVEGHVIEPTYEYLSGLISAPLPFKCNIVPRSKEAAALIPAANTHTPSTQAQQKH
ncbi:cytochrome P450 [Mycena crocata]|nr:cytochrome P450 [Mycena crocata]